MDGDDAAARAARRDLVRRGYDAISLAYRDDNGRASASGSCRTSMALGEDL